MTALVGWIAKDTNGMSSAYLLSDSRISWGTSGTAETYNYAKKIFAFENSPDILGYCGDVLFPISVLQQIETLAREGLLFADGDDANTRSEKIFKQLKKQFYDYPTKYMADSFEIYHIGRDSYNMASNFLCFRYAYSKKSNALKKEKIEPSNDLVIIKAGSGKKHYADVYYHYQHRAGGLSRNVYQSFCDYLLNPKTVTVGGAPQCAGLQRKGNGKLFGIIWKNNRYLFGSPIQDTTELSWGKIHWFNENMEQCDGKTKLIKEGATKQPNLLKINGETDFKL